LASRRRAGPWRQRACAAACIGAAGVAPDVLERRPPRESAGGVTSLQIIPLFKIDGLLSALACTLPTWGIRKRRLELSRAKLLGLPRCSRHARRRPHRADAAIGRRPPRESAGAYSPPQESAGRPRAFLLWYGGCHHGGTIKMCSQDLP
jgi:hypothetical protein